MTYGEIFARTYRASGYLTNVRRQQVSIIRELCEQIVRHLDAIGFPLSKFLLPGFSDEEIRKVQATLPFVFPSSLVEMYKWHNGTELVAGTCFFPWWTFDKITESM